MVHFLLIEKSLVGLFVDSVFFVSPWPRLFVCWRHRLMVGTVCMSHPMLLFAMFPKPVGCQEF